MLKDYQTAAEYVQSKITKAPEIGLILGSGLGVIANQVQQAIRIPFTDIPGFPESTVEGHQGRVVIGELQGKQVLVMQGRFHFYEGYALEQVTLPVRMMKALGIENVLVTNAAGGINEDFQAGDLMLITDHLNLTGQNPLIGANEDSLGVRFPDMSQAYTPEYISLAEQVAKSLDIKLQKGVYVGVTGPSYETPAEIRMMRYLGADAVGMSTVPEVIVATHAGMKVLGISCISNMAAGILDQPLTHDEVMETADLVQEKFISLVLALIHRLEGK